MDNRLGIFKSFRFFFRSVVLVVFCWVSTSYAKSNENNGGKSSETKSIAFRYDTIRSSVPAVSSVKLELPGFVSPGDAIKIDAYPDSTSFIRGFYPVDGHGQIYLPIIGKLRVTTMTETQFLDTLKAAYISYLRYPNLQVRKLIRLSLLGGFLRPGLYYLDPDFSMWDAVYQAGGTTREDGLKRMQWERDRKPVTQNVIPYIQTAQSLRDIGFKSGDQLWTPVEPKREWWDVLVRDVVLSQVFPIVSTSASLYISYMMYKSYQRR